MTDNAAYSSDAPISDKAEDRFDRYSFSCRVAETIVSRRDISSLTVGIYGAWGDGKTSVLHMMQQALKEHGEIITISFNPWHFGSQVDLLKGFFASLASALGRSSTTKLQEAGKILQKYGGLLSFASASVGAAGIGVNVDPGKGIKNLGDALSTVDLEDMKHQIEKHLKESEKRVVVFIDDIDRLDKDEIHSIFKLVRLSAGFSYTTYVLAFDDDVVAASLGERYGAGSAEAGKSFLEKIVQVPLRLPNVPRDVLRSFVLEGVEAAVNASSIEIEKGEVQKYLRCFSLGIEPKITTPRHARLYSNSLLFALPILKGEVNAVDQMLIEAVKTFHPKLYRFIRDNPEKCVRDAFHAPHQESYEQNLRSAFHDQFESLLPEDREGLFVLIKYLFPQLESVFDNIQYGDDSYKKWLNEKRICTSEYFQRYFGYAIPRGDISDQEVDKFMDDLEGADADNIAQRFTAYQDKGAFSRLIQKFRLREDTLSPDKATALARALAPNGALLPREHSWMMSDETIPQAAILISRLVRHSATDPEDREELASEIIRSVEPLPFAFECFKKLRFYEEDASDRSRDNILNEGTSERVGRHLAQRISEFAEGNNLFELFGDQAPPLIYVWKKFGDQDEVEGYVRKIIDADLGQLDVFLACFVGLAWEAGTGLSHVSDLRRDNYNQINGYICPSYIVQKIKAKHGSEVDNPEYFQSSDIPVSLRLARQFIFLHKHVKKTEQEEAQEVKS